MGLESFLIQIKPGATDQSIKTIIYKIQGLGGKVNMTAGQKKAIIAYFDNSYVDVIRKLPSVKLVGGVNINKREIKRIRVEKK